MRTILAAFAGFAAVPIFLWIVIAIAASMSPLTRDYLTLGAWFIAAIVAGGLIMAIGLIVAFVVRAVDRSN